MPKRLKHSQDDCIDIECISRDLLKKHSEQPKKCFQCIWGKPSMGAPSKEHLIPENTFVIYYNLKAKGFT